MGPHRDTSKWTGNRKQSKNSGCAATLRFVSELARMLFFRFLFAKFAPSPHGCTIDSNVLV